MFLFYGGLAPREERVPVGAVGIVMRVQPHPELLQAVVDHTLEVEPAFGDWRHGHPTQTDGKAVRQR